MIAVEGLSIRQGEFALREVSFVIRTGEYAVLTGPTGCGKTTLLECLAGLRTPTAGRITLAGRDATALPPDARTVGYVPQDAAVFTSMSVWHNLAFGLTVRQVPKAEIERRVKELADRLGLTQLLGRRAARLSGGEAQRVALGRALAFRPPVLLLDEPLNAVDEVTAERVVACLQPLRDTERPTVIHATHQPAEAATLADVRLRIEAGCVTSSP
jgi:ABC-type sugar transport system ATPase subunit